MIVFHVFPCLFERSMVDYSVVWYMLCYAAQMFTLFSNFSVNLAALTWFILLFPHNLWSVLHQPFQSEQHTLALFGL
jgi:hypothetical protein